MLLVPMELLIMLDGFTCVDSQLGKVARKGCTTRFSFMTISYYLFYTLIIYPIMLLVDLNYLLTIPKLLYHQGHF